MTTPREQRAMEAEALGLTCTKTTSDGWEQAWTRADGLHIWKIRRGFQTARFEGGIYCRHKSFDTMKEAAGREVE